MCFFTAREPYIVSPLVVGNQSAQYKLLRMALDSNDTSGAGPTPSSEKDTLPPKSHDVLTKNHMYNTEDSALFNSPATMEGKPTPPTCFFLDRFRQKSEP